MCVNGGSLISAQPVFQCNHIHPFCALRGGRKGPFVSLLRLGVLIALLVPFLPAKSDALSPEEARPVRRKCSSLPSLFASPTSPVLGSEAECAALLRPCRCAQQGSAARRCEWHTSGPSAGELLLLLLSPPTLLGAVLRIRETGVKGRTPGNDAERRRRDLSPSCQMHLRGPMCCCCAKKSLPEYPLPSFVMCVGVCVSWALSICPRASSYRGSSFSLENYPPAAGDDWSSGRRPVWRTKKAPKYFRTVVQKTTPSAFVVYQ